MKSLFTFCLSLLFFTAQAQDYVIDLNKQTLSLSRRTFYLSKVIDVRLEKSNLGYVKTGAMNARKVAVFPQPLPETLMHFIGRYLPPSPTLPAVILKVVALEIKEQNKSLAEAAVVQMQVDFIYEKEPGEYQLLYEASSTIEKKGMEVTAFHDDNVARAINDCLNQFSEQNIPQLIRSSESITPEQLEANVLAGTESLAFPILRDTVLRAGVYQNFQEFRNNTPGITQPLHLVSEPRKAKGWEGTYQVHPFLRTANGDKRLKDAWGFSDGKQLYVFFQGEYFPLNRNNNVCTFYGHFPVNADGSRITISYGGISTGLVGAAIIGAAASSAQANSKTQYVLNMLTGRVMELNDYTPQINQSVKIIIYYKGIKTATATSITLTNQKDSLINELKPNSWLELQWSDLRADLQLCITGQTPSCFVFAPATDKANYFEYSPGDKKSPVPVIRTAIPQEADFYIKKFRAAQATEEKKNQR